MNSEEQRQLDAKFKETLGESYKDIKLGGMPEVEKNNVLLVMYIFKKITGTTIISSLRHWDK